MKRFCERARMALKAACVVCLVAGPMTIELCAAPAYAGQASEPLVVASVWGWIKKAVKWYVEQINCDPSTDPNCGMLG
jgi:hypothetical protein